MAMNEPTSSAGTSSGREPPHADLAQRLVHLPDELGAQAVPVLREALQHPDPWVRAHAVAALARIDHADACAALVTAMHDDSFGVHWAAARTLAACGRRAVAEVLRALTHDTPATGFLHGAMHVLRYAALTPREREAVAPVLEAVHHPAADLEAPVLAAAALKLFATASTTMADAALAPPVPWYRTRRDRHGERGRILAPPAER